MFSVEKIAAGHIICFAGSCKVEWWEAINNWQFLSDKFVCAACYSDSLSTKVFAFDAVFFTGMTKFVFRSSSNVVIAFAFVI